MDVKIDTKKCSGECGQVRPFEDFYKSKNGKFGRESECNICKKQYRLNNADRRREYDKQYRIDNIDRKKELGRKHYIKNKEKIDKYQYDKYIRVYKE